MNPVWRINAAVIGAGWRFAALHESVRVGVAEETVQQVADFAALRTRRVEMALSDGGWFRISRNPAGRILLRYRVGQLSAGTALEGEVRLEGESAESFCRELGGLL